MLLSSKYLATDFKYTNRDKFLFLGSLYFKAENMFSFRTGARSLTPRKLDIRACIKLGYDIVYFKSRRILQISGEL